MKLSLSLMLLTLSFAAGAEPLLLDASCELTCREESAATVGTDCGPGYCRPAPGKETRVYFDFTGLSRDQLEADVEGIDSG